MPERPKQLVKDDVIRINGQEIPYRLTRSRRRTLGLSVTEAGVRVNVPKWGSQEEIDRFLEERWLFEAVTETYIPLVKFLDRLTSEQVDFRLTLSLSPTLSAMLEDRELGARYLRHLELCRRLGDAEIERTRYSPELNKLHSNS